MSPTGNAAVLIVGSGGREHALCVALARSLEVGRVVFAGGDNAGMAAIAERIDPETVLARATEFDLVVVGPEAPLVDGLADDLRALGVPVFGPGKAGAELEASKAFTKAIAAEADIPTAAARIADSREEAHAALAEMGAPVVVKADGLAAGKGVVMADTMEAAKAAVDACFEGAFGAAGARVVIEEMMVGPEVSLFALSDGTAVRPFATARDFKRAFDGDLGPNTGGMGAVSPAPGVPDAVIDEAMARIVKPTVDALAARGIPYVGILYAGLMLTAEGPKLIEFNVRFGDPECQAILPRLSSDFYALLLATATGRLADAPMVFSPDSAVAVVVAAEGYPGPLNKGEVIAGLDQVAAAGAEVYHAGTRAADGKVLSNGGRVLAAVALGSNPEAAREKVYGALEKLDWPGGRMRTDIAAA